MGAGNWLQRVFAPRTVHLFAFQIGPTFQVTKRTTATLSAAESGGPVHDTLFRLELLAMVC